LIIISAIFGGFVALLPNFPATSFTGKIALQASELTDPK
jgi:hypothetical protein